MTQLDLSIEGGYELLDGKKIPRVAYGTYDIGEGEAATRAVTEAIDAGYRLIDCARFYGNEREVGRALAAAKVPREELFVSSKVWNDRQLDGTVRESFEETLRDLQVDYLDLFLIHWPVPGKFLETWNVLQGLQEEGLVRSIGVCNFTDDQLRELIDASGQVPVVDQMEHHPYMQDEKTRAFCEAHGIRYEAWSPFGRGGDLADETVARIAQAHGASPAQLIVNWHVAEGVVPLPRSTNPEHMPANAEALAEPLTAAELAEIDGLNRHGYILSQVSPADFSMLDGTSSHFE